MNFVPGCDLAGIDFVQLAEGLGVTARRVDAPEGIDEALEWSFEQSGPTLVDFRIA